MKEPLIGWRLENGNPADQTFKARVQLLEIDVIGDGTTPTRCVVNEEAGEGSDPFDFLLESRTESAWIVSCSERPKSTRVVSADKSVVLLGHLDFVSNEDGGNRDWEFIIDEIPRAPRIAEFEPKDSFTWDAPLPPASPIVDATAAPRVEENAVTQGDRRTFHGYLCRAGCAGHRAGYRWALRHGIMDSDKCPADPHNSHSFTEGCWAEAGREGP